MSQMFDLALLCLVYMFHNINCEWVENKGLWYYISRNQQPVNYDKAVDICDTLNARLAVITYDDQREFLKGAVHDSNYRWIDSSHKSYNTGTAFYNGEQIADDYSEKHGFICQWECKRIYMHFEGGECSGVYTFDSYYNGNLQYYKEQSRNCHIYRSMSQVQWVVTKKYNLDYVYEYVHNDVEPDLYVPYTKVMSWKTYGYHGKNISAGSFCIECDHLNVCLYGRQSSEICYNGSRLTYESSYPTYIYNDKTAVITYNTAVDQPCIWIEPIGHKCGYLFPYPKKTTIGRLKNNNYLSITNMCTRGHIKIPTIAVQSSPVQTTDFLTSITFSATQTKDVTGSQFSIEEYTTSAYETTSISVSEQKSTQNNKIITLSVPIAAVVIVIIIVSIVFVHRRKRKRRYDEDPGGINMRNDGVTNAQFHNNVYLELPESNSNRNVKDLPDKDSNGGEYSYVDFATPGARQASTEIVKTPRLEVKPSGATHFEVAQNTGYLAPDYGVLMDRNSKQADNGHVDNKQEANSVYSQTSDSNPRVKSISQSPGDSESDYDLQLHENEVYDASADGKLPNNPKTENVYYNDVNANVESGINPQTKPKHHSNENCPNKYVVSDSIDEGDDLELFENSVYEHNQ